MPSIIPEISGRQQEIALAWYDPDTSTLRMSQGSLLPDISGESYPTLPDSVIYFERKLFPLPRWVLPISDSGGGLSENWPTPKGTASGPGHIDSGNPRGRHQGNALATAVNWHDARQGQEGQLNPDWVEWLMGWPIGWTSLEPLRELIWLDWEIDPADGESQEMWPTPRDCSKSNWHNVSMDAVKRRIEKTGYHCNLEEKVAMSNSSIGSIPRIATNIPDRVNRLKAIGNGQVPLVAATAWRILNE